MQLICGSCLGFAPSNAQWFNQDTGYGICPKCWANVLSHEVRVLGEIEGLRNALSYYGMPGKHHSIDGHSPQLFHAVLASRVEYGSHETDLYLPVNERTAKLLDAYEYRSNVTTFKSQIDGKQWFDVPFAYLPAWEAKQRKISRAE